MSGNRRRASTPVRTLQFLVVTDTMYATRGRKVKTGRRDARCLAEACRLGAYRTLKTVPGIGAVTAVTFHATMDDCSRFASARAVRPYLGLAPSERSSGEKRQVGHITKRAQSGLRSLLVLPRIVTFEPHGASPRFAVRLERELHRRQIS